MTITGDARMVFPEQVTGIVDTQLLLPAMGEDELNKIHDCVVCPENCTSKIPSDRMNMSTVKICERAIVW